MSVSRTAAALTPAIFQRKGSRDARAPSDEDRTFLQRDAGTGWPSWRTVPLVRETTAA